jgi:PAS domain S-box-containing protein
MSMATILVVDDHGSNREYLSTLLSNCGHRTLAAADGIESLATALAERPDLIITDILMPAMDGYELVRSLRSNPATAGVPVIFYTAKYQEAESRPLVEAGGVSLFLPKPSDPEVVLAAVDAALRGEPPETLQLGVKEYDREHLRLLTDKLAIHDEQLRKLSRAVEQSPVSVVITDLEGSIEYINPRFTEVTGYTLEEVLGKNPRILKSGEMPPEAYQHLWQTIKAGGVWRGEFYNRKKNGELYWERASISPILDERGSITHFVAVKEDITEWKRTEAELRLQSRLIDLAHDAILIRKPGGEIAYWNQGAQRIYGWPREQAVGRIAQDLLKTQFPIPLSEIEAQVMREGSWEGELVQFRADGQVVIVASHWVVDREDPSAVKPILQISSDITERKRARALVERRAEELAQSNAELEQFAYVVSHDLQEPLRMVASYLELLAKRYKGQLDEKADTFINYAVDGAVRMKILIDELLSLSRVTTKAKPLRLMDSQIALDEARENLRHAISEKKAVVTSSSLPAIRGDYTQIVQLFQNLIGNGIKFCEAKPPHVHVAAECRGDEWVFSVRDNGIGIAAHHMERIFKIFQRLHGRTSYPGTGMGLAICKKVVERHGGKIWAESRPDHGSTFYFTIPKGTSINKKLGS